MVKFIISPSQSKITMNINKQKSMTHDRRKSNPIDTNAEMTTVLKHPQKAETLLSFLSP